MPDPSEVGALLALLHTRAARVRTAACTVLLAAACSPSNAPPSAPVATAKQNASNDPAARLERARAAEKQLVADFAAGKVGNVERVVTFEELASWKYEEGLKGMPPEVRALSGKDVAMVGWMVSMEAEEHAMTEFMLTRPAIYRPYCDGPDIHENVRVVLPKDKPTDLHPLVRVAGRFKIAATFMDGYCVDIYELQAERVEAIQ
jgi:hypothetical protein